MLSPEDIHDQFPLFHDTFENVSGSRSFPIGVNLDYPVDLINKLVATCLSVELGLKSVDHVARTYMTDFQTAVRFGEDQRKRVDRDVSKDLREVCLLIFAANKSAPSSKFEIDHDHAGLNVCNLTLLRLPNSIDEAMRCADRGSLYECCAIARFALESFCWAMAIRSCRTSDEVFNISVTRSIGLAKKSVPEVGIYYGWLSKHAHWHPDSHRKAITELEGREGIMLRSSAFKAEAYIVCLVLLLVFSKLLAHVVHDIRFASRSLCGIADIVKLMWQDVLLTYEYLKGTKSDVAALLVALHNEPNS